MENFRSALGVSESSNRYDVVNDEGYTGKYQFGPERLQDYMRATGSSFSMNEFKDNPALQEAVQAWHEQDIICRNCECGFSFDMKEDSLAQQDRGEDGVWVTVKCPACLNDVLLHKLNG